MNQKREAFCEKEVSDEDARLIAPFGISRINAPSQLSSIHNIIVEQSGGMDKFNEAGHGDVNLSMIPAQFGGKQDEFGPKPFPAAKQEIFANSGNDGDIGLEVLSKLLIHFFQIVSNTFVDDFQRRCLLSHEGM